MKKSKQLIIMTIIGLLSLVGVIMPFNNLQTKTEEKIREILLTSTPLGTNMEDIIIFIEGNGWGIDYIDHERGFWHQRIYPNRTIGEKSIRVKMGEYGLILKTSVTVYWGFDQYNELVEIWV